MNKQCLLFAPMAIALVFTNQFCVSPTNSVGVEVDTTSHEVDWSVYQLGGATSSHFEDVAVINDDSVWAVGDLFTEDSLGQVDPLRYNGAVWDGHSWKLERIPYRFQGAVYYNPIRSIFHLENAGVLFSGNGVLHLDGTNYSEIDLPADVWGANEVLSAWGLDRADFYLVGRNGAMAQFRSGTWKKLESHSTTDILDIWGNVDPQSLVRRVLCAASSPSQPSDSRVLTISGPGTVDTIVWGTHRRIVSLWFEGSKGCYAAGDGVFVLSKEGRWEEVSELPKVFSRKIRGNAMNDVFLGGDFGLLAHYNGATWRIYGAADVASADISWQSISVRGHTIAAAGYKGDKAVVALGRRR